MKKKKTKELEKQPRSEKQRRLGLIASVMKANDVKGNPRDYVAIAHARQILDVSGVYEIKARLPSTLEPGNHVWVRGSHNGKEVLAPAIVIEDNIEVDGLGDKKHVMLCDEPKTKEFLLSRDDLAPLPLTLNPMVIHKSKLDNFFPVGWSDVFWNHKLKRRRSKPRVKEFEK